MSTNLDDKTAFLSHLKLRFLECSVCTEDYNDNEHSPRLLPCKHSVCAACLKKMCKKAGQFVCPHCTKTHNYTAASDNCAKDFTRGDLIDFVQSQIVSKCDECKESNGKLRCVTCSTIMCRTCYEKTKAGDNHVDHLIEDVTIHARYARCYKPGHDKGLLSHYCSQCAELVCSACIFYNHRDKNKHTIDKIENVVTKCKLKLKDIHTNMQTKIQVVTLQRNIIQARLQGRKLDKGVWIKKIETCEKIKENEKDDLISFLTRILNEDIHILKFKQKAVRRLYGILEGLYESVGQMVLKSTDMFSFIILCHSTVSSAECKLMCFERLYDQIISILISENCVLEETMPGVQMNHGMVSTLFERYLECPVCVEEYDDDDRIPRLLPCNHTYCTACLQRLSGQTNSITCPQCKEKHEIKDNEHSYPQDVMRRDMLVFLSSNNQHKCGVCNTNESRVRCFTCQENVCDPCQQKHKAEKFDCEVSAVFYPLDKVLKCQKYGHADNSLDYFCTECNQIVCMSCVFSNHRDVNEHTITSLQIVVTEYDRVRFNMDLESTTLHRDIQDFIQKKSEQLKEGVSHWSQQTTSMLFNGEISPATANEVFETYNQALKQALDYSNSQIDKLEVQRSRLVNYLLNMPPLVDVRFFIFLKFINISYFATLRKAEKDFKMALEESRAIINQDPFEWRTVCKGRRTLGSIPFPKESRRNLKGRKECVRLPSYLSFKDEPTRPTGNTAVVIVGVILVFFGIIFALFL